MLRIHAIDSHTEGEPTRIIVAGGPDLGGGSIADQRRVFQQRFDTIRSAVVNEPRGCDHLVGAVLCRPVNPKAAAGVIFFNNVGMLNGCGHGTIGLAVTLAHLGRIGPGEHLIETPVGDVTILLEAGNLVTITNVPSYRHRHAVELDVNFGGSIKRVRGDVAWGGNWFFLVDMAGPLGHGLPISLENRDALTHFSVAVRQSLESAGITGADGGVIDHIELFGPPTRQDCHSRNFVLCPGREYDRSPCGTGTSAKLACLAADHKLEPGQVWGQESLIASAFHGWYSPDASNPSRVIPSIRGRAWVTSETTLILDPADPFAHGIRSAH